MKTSKLFSSVVKSASVLVGSSMLAAGVVSAPAHAIVAPCPASAATDVTGVTGCQRSDSANQDFLNTSPMTVNSEAFFGISNWTFGGKIGENAGYNGTGSGQSGTWNLASIIQPGWSNVMLLFKSGNGTTLTGYTVASGTTSGTWTSPFDVPGNNGRTITRDVSHISVYYTAGSNTGGGGGGNAQAVPEPTTMAGLAAAGAGLVAARRRKAAAK